MYSDLFDQLGRGGGGGRSGTAAEPVEEPPLLSVKAGKMILAAANDNDSFHCTADTARGEIRLVWKDAALQWQWYDRRSKTVQDSFAVSQQGGGTFERVPLTDKTHENDRVYVWTSTDDNSKTEHRMYWMQDAEVGDEAEVVKKVNEYLKDPNKAAPAGAATATTGASSSSAAAASGTAGAAASSSNANQVDALSSILENLGMPQTSEGSTTATSSAAAAAAPSSSGTTNQLTLADLQGAMAGIHAGTTTTTSPAPGPPLNDVLTTQAIDALLESEDVVQRLLPLLPAGQQQSVEQLRANLTSPQMRNTVSALQQALLPDDTGDLSGYASVVANFQLESDGQSALLAQGNPLAAFLESVIASVEKEKQEKKDEEEEGKESEENKEGGDEEGA